MAPSSRTFVVRSGNTEVEAELTGPGRVRLGKTGQDIDVESCGDGEYLVREGGRTWRVHVAGPPDRRHVHVDGLAAQVDIVPAGRAPARQRHQDLAAVAPMPATVVEILVTTGQAVHAGDVLLTLEAMKMEMPVRAPRSGTVGVIHCAEGELVQPGVVLVDIA